MWHNILAAANTVEKADNLLLHYISQKTFNNANTGLKKTKKEKFSN